MPVWPLVMWFGLNSIDAKYIFTVHWNSAVKMADKMSHGHHHGRVAPLGTFLSLDTAMNMFYTKFSSSLARDIQRILANRKDELDLSDIWG